MFWKLKSGLIADQLVYRIHCIYWHIELLSEFTIDMTEKMCNQEALTKQALTERNLKFAGSGEQRRWLCILPGTASVTRMTCPPFTGERALKSHKGHPVTTNSCLSARFTLILICLLTPSGWVKKASFCERSSFDGCAGWANWIKSQKSWAVTACDLWGQAWTTGAPW